MCTGRRSATRVACTIATLVVVCCAAGATLPASAAEERPASEIEWRSIGLASSGWMRSISAHPREADVLWAVADMGGGIVRTRNGGRSWADVTETAIRDTRYGGFLSVFVHPEGTVFVGVRGGLIRSDGDGKTWERTDIALDRDPVWIEFQEAGPEVIYCVDNLGTVYRSADTGRTWEVAFREPELERLEQDVEYRVPGYAAKIRAVPTDGPDGYALFRSHPHFGVTRSTDGGDTWSPSNAGLPHTDVRSLDWCRDAESSTTMLLALLEGRLSADGSSWEGGVYVSSDLGETWTARNQGIVTHVPARFLSNHVPAFNSLEASKRVPGLVYVLAGEVCDREVAVLRTDDAGEHWTCLHTNYVNTDVNGAAREICRLPYHNAIALAQSDPSVFYCMASSPMLRFEKRGELARQIEYEPLDPETGRYRWLGVSHVCTRGVAPDPFRNVVHTINHDVGYNRVDLDDGTVDFRCRSETPWSQGNGILVDPGNSGTLYFGGSKYSSYMQRPTEGGLFRSTDYGETFRPIGAGEGALPSGYVFDLALDPTSPAEARRLYASVGGAGVYLSEDSGETWRSAHDDLPAVSQDTALANVHRLHVDSQGGVYTILYGGAPPEHGGRAADITDNRLFYKASGASAWRELADSDTFGGAVFDLLGEPGRPDVLYVAGYPGVFRSEDAGGTRRRVLENMDANVSAAERAM